MTLCCGKKILYRPKNCNSMTSLVMMHCVMAFDFMHYAKRHESVSDSGSLLRPLWYDEDMCHAFTRHDTFLMGS